MLIKDNEIHIYRIKFSEHAKYTEDYKSIMSADELQKAVRYKFEILRQNYITGRSMLRIILFNYLHITPSEIQFNYTKKGKPYLTDNDLNFNLSHSGDYTVYAFSREDEVGIDLELIRDIPDAKKISERYFSDMEIKDLNEVEDEYLSGAFLNCWTRKEAFIKATGEGLSYPLQDFSVSLKPEADAEITWIKNEDKNKWSLYDLSIGNDYVSCLAVNNKKKKIKYIV